MLFPDVRILTNFVVVVAAVVVAVVVVVAVGVYLSLNFRTGSTYEAWIRVIGLLVFLSVTDVAHTKLFVHM